MQFFLSSNICHHISNELCEIVIDEDLIHFFQTPLTVTYLGQQRKSLVFDLCLWRCRRKYAEDACSCFLGLKCLQCSHGNDCEF